MSVYFNADEVLQMAEQIERNGAVFYSAAAEKISDPKKQRLLLNLAAMEKDHENVFSSMRAALASKEQEPTVFDPDDQTGQYLRAMADGKVFDVHAEPTSLFAGGESIEDILRTAIGMEKDSIIFYLGMKAMVGKGLGKDKIDAIIAEEMSHIGVLSLELTSLRPR